MKKNNKKCKLCSGVNDTTGSYCQKCYYYLKIHPNGTYKIPDKGTVAYAPNGDVICHVCGKAFRKLGNHIRFCHNMTQHEYKDKFQLYHNTRLSNDEYIKNMASLNAINKEKVVKNNLIVKGENTRLTSKHNVNKLKGTKRVKLKKIKAQKNQV